MLDLFLTNTAKSIDANFQHQRFEDNKIDERVNLGDGKNRPRRLETICR